MAALRAIALALAAMPVPVAAQSTSDHITRWHPMIVEAAARFAIPKSWIERVMRAESGGLTELGGRPIRSRTGAIGLMQLMPATWESMRSAYRLGENPDDPHDNIIAGTAYLRLMYDRFGYPGMFAAYNAGPGRYAAYLAGRSPLPGETMGYLAGVTGSTAPATISPAAPPRQLLFSLRHDLGDGEPSATDRPAENGLFAVRKGMP